MDENANNDKRPAPEYDREWKQYTRVDTGHRAAIQRESELGLESDEAEEPPDRDRRSGRPAESRPPRTGRGPDDVV
jgi:hypothetical protein